MQTFREFLIEATTTILSIDGPPHKSTSSSGRWAIPITVNVQGNFGGGQTESFKYFWKKKEALTWIKQTDRILKKGKGFVEKP